MKRDAPVTSYDSGPAPRSVLGGRAARLMQAFAVTACSVSFVLGVAGAERDPRVDLAVGYRVDPDWPRPPSGVEWEAMSGVAVDSQDQVWTLNRGSLPVQVFDRLGRLVNSWGEGLLKGPHHLRIDTRGHVWIADYELHAVMKFTPEGELIQTLGTLGQLGEDDRHFSYPTDMAVTASGDVYVADGYGNNRVVHFDAQGRFVKAWGKLGSGPGEFSLPHSIAVDSRGRVYVADRNNARIQVFGPDGTFIDEWRNLIVPWGIWISPQDEVFVCGSSPMHWGESEEFGLPPKDQLVMKFRADGRVLELWTFPNSPSGTPGVLEWVHGIAMDARGNLYLGDIEGMRVQRFIRLEPSPSVR